MELPLPPDMTKMGTASDLALTFKTADDKELEQCRQEVNNERDAREARGEGHMYSEMQPSVMPKMKDLVRAKIEMLFEAFDADGDLCLEWSHGVVRLVVNSSTRRVEIVWYDSCVHPDDWSSMKITKDVLAVRKWNPEVAVKGAWQLYLVQ